MKTPEAIDQFLKDNELRYAKGSIYQYGNVIKLFFRTCQKEFSKVEADDIKKWLLKCNNFGLSPSTIRNYLISLRVFFSYCLEENLIQKDPIQNISPPEIPDQLPVYLNRTQLNNLREVFKDNVKYRAIVEFLYSTGVRISELRNIKLQDINWNERKIRVWGKGEKERIVLFTPQCAERLKKYLSLRKVESPYLFAKTTGITKRFRSYSKKLGFRVTPHTLRHTFAAHLAEKGMTLACLQDLMGHDNIKNTRIYSRLFAHAKKKLYDMYL